MIDASVLERNAINRIKKTMTENLKNVTSQLIEKYLEILEEQGDPNEAYKYLAINAFQKHWNIEAEDFHQMFRDSFSKVANLLYQNSWGFIIKSAELFPEEVREMFRKLYNESVDISHRIKNFQTESEQLLPRVRQALNRTNINAQQDERTISVYLAFRFPEKYMLYKADYYKSFCEQLDIKTKKTGERFLHLQELAQQIVQEGVVDNDNFLNTYRKFYSKPDWEDQYLMIQNVLYVVFREDLNGFNFFELLKKFDRKQVEEYYNFLDLIIEFFGLQQDDNRLVFNADKNKIVFTIGQRYIWNTATIGKDDFKFRTISEKQISNNFVNFDGTPTAFLCKLNDISEAQKNKQSILNAIEKELARTQISSYSKFNKKELEQMAFDIDFRNGILGQLEYQTITEKPMESINTTTKVPLNQILFGAPGTGKTYTLINEYFEQFTIKESSLTKEQFAESIITDLSWWQVITLALIDLKTAKVNEIHEHPFVKIKESISKSKTIRPTIWGQLQAHTIKECEFVNVEKRQDPLYFYKDENSNWTIKEELLNELYPDGKQLFESYSNFKPSSDKQIKNYEFVTFHQSFSYEDFIEGIKPDLSVEDGELVYKIEDGIFKQLCNKARRDPYNRYALFIDEINRGNISAIFGELITLIEDSKRAGSKDAVEVILPYSKEKFSVPNNVYIIGTMNTADRSVEALDTALRRRFSFVEMQPNPNVLLNSEYTDVNLKQLLETINQRIEILIDKDHKIGHSYFIGIRNLEDLKLAFKDKIIPLLEEYFYGDFGKIGLVLGGSFIYQEENSATFPTNFIYENDFLEDKKVYLFTPFENWDESTFISVYED